MAGRHYKKFKEKFQEKFQKYEDRPDKDVGFPIKLSM
jgi:hypothetical protein